MEREKENMHFIQKDYNPGRNTDSPVSLQKHCNDEKI